MLSSSVVVRAVQILQMRTKYESETLKSFTCILLVSANFYLSAFHFAERLAPAGRPADKEKEEIPNPPPVFSIAPYPIRKGEGFDSLSSSQGIVSSIIRLAIPLYIGAVYQSVGDSFFSSPSATRTCISRNWKWRGKQIDILDFFLCV